MKVLAVNRSIFVCETLGLFVKDLRHEFCMASSGQEALEILKNDKIDFLFTGCDLNDMLGSDLIEQVRQIENIQSIPIAVVTKETSEEKKEKCKELGVKAWIPRPFKKETIEKVIEELTK
jgi:two-component system chemotaxis response regulator CheY